jgi:hypothetical protein
MGSGVLSYGSWAHGSWAHGSWAHGSWAHRLSGLWVHCMGSRAHDATLPLLDATVKSWNRSCEQFSPLPLRSNIPSSDLCANFGLLRITNYKSRFNLESNIWFQRITLSFSRYSFSATFLRDPRNLSTNWNFYHWYTPRHSFANYFTTVHSCH